METLCRSALASLGSLRQRPKAQHELPALRLGEKAERRHALSRVATADLPEQRAVALRLNIRERQVRALRRAAAIVGMTRRASLLEDLAASRFRVGAPDER